MRFVTVLACALVLAACGTGCPAASCLAPGSPTTSPTSSTTPTTDVCRDGAITYCVVNPAVTQATVDQTICRPGYTRTIRPPLAYTDQLKRQQLLQFGAQHRGDPKWTLAGTEEDHRLPLELGGAPGDEHNLSPEERPQADTKDADETAFNHLVCSGRVGLVSAQIQFIGRWLSGWPEYKEAP